MAHLQTAAWKQARGIVAQAAQGVKQVNSTTVLVAVVVLVLDSSSLLPSLGFDSRRAAG